MTEGQTSEEADKQTTVKRQVQLDVYAGYSARDGILPQTQTTPQKHVRLPLPPRTEHVVPSRFRLQGFRFRVLGFGI